VEGCEAEGVEEAMKKVALMALGIAVSALLYAEVGMMITFALLVVLFVALALNQPKSDQPRGL